MMFTPDAVRLRAEPVLEEAGLARDRRAGHRADEMAKQRAIDTRGSNSTG